MNERIKAIFLLIRENQVIAAESNLKELIENFPDEIRNLRSYDYFYRAFLDTNYFQFELNRNYFFQKKEYANGKAIT